MPKKLRPLGDDWLLNLRTLKVNVRKQSVFYPGCDKSSLNCTEANSAYIFNGTSTHINVYKI